MESLRGVLVGCGFFSQFQLEAWARIPGVEISALCDLDADRARALADQYNVTTVFNDFEIMLDAEQPDFADIVTRPEQHLALAEAAAQRGIHVLCQKPFAPTIAEAARIVEVCQGVRLMVNENWRWQAWYREIARVLQSGGIGEPFAFRWLHRANDGLLTPPYPNQPYFASYSRFLIYETLVHYLDAARFLFGEPSRLYCQTARVNPVITGEDAVWITLTFPGSLRGVIDGNRCSPLGEEGTAMGNLRIDGTGGSLWLAASGEILIQPRGGDRVTHSWAIPETGYRGDSCYNTQRHFVDCLRSGAPFESSGEDYLRTMRLVDACYESAATGSSISL
jgi:predicted dehydrogenase